MLNILGHNYMTITEAALAIGYKPESLQQAKSRGSSPIPYLMHQGRIHYLVSDVETHLEDAPLRELEVPVQPIADYLQRIGGRPPGTGVDTRIERDDERGGREDVIDRTPEEESVISGLKSKLKSCRVKRGGMIPYLDADAICCDVLKVHPVDVFGPEWFDFAPEVDEDDDHEPAPVLRVVA